VKPDRGTKDKSGNGFWARRRPYCAGGESSGADWTGYAKIFFRCHRRLDDKALRIN
jgi:hypothetical protein